MGWKITKWLLGIIITAIVTIFIEGSIKNMISSDVIVESPITKKNVVTGAGSVSPRIETDRIDGKEKKSNSIQGTKSEIQVTNSSPIKQSNITHTIRIAYKKSLGEKLNDLREANDLITSGYSLPEHSANKEYQLFLDIHINNQTFKFSDQTLRLRNISSGKQSYSITGQVKSPTHKVYNVVGMGKLDVSSDSTYYVKLLFKENGICSASLE